MTNLPLTLQTYMSKSALKKSLAYFITILLIFSSLQLLSQEEEQQIHPLLFGVELSEQELLIALKNNIASNPSYSRNWLMLGSFWENTLQYDSAAYAYTKAFELDTTCVKCKQQLAGVMAIRGMVKEAIGFYNKTLSLDSTNTTARIQLARLLKRESKFKESLKHFEWLLNKDTTNFYLWEQVGDCSMRIDSIGKGLYSYNRSFELNQANMPLAVKLINAYLQTGIPPMFYIEVANIALKYDSTYVPLIRAKGYLHFLSQDYKTSEIWFNNAFELGDSTRFTLKFLGINKYHNGSFFSSTQFLEKAFTIDTTDKALNFVYAKSLIEIGDRNKSIEVLDLTESVITPSREEMGMLYATRANAYSRGQKYTNAIEQYTRALEFDPEQLEYLFEIGVCHFNSKEFSTSLSVLNRFIELAENQNPQKGSTSKRIPSARYYIKQIEKELFFLD